MLSSDPSNELSGKVLRISSQARPADQRGAASPEFEVQVLVLAPPDVTLRVGAAAQVRLELKPMAGGLLVPLTALRWRDDGKPLLRVRADGRGDVLRPVETGRTTADSVEVRSGIAEADEVWVPGPDAAGSQKSGLLQRLFNTGDE